MLKNKTALPEQFSSVEEIQEFWDSHSTAEYWEEMEDVEMELSSALRAQFELKKLYRLLGLSSQQILTIEEKAKREHTDSRQLISKWVLEHVRHHVHHMPIS
ncbi:MAG: hypothetical protein GY862_38910 [Gammaproteobacteria bacterium]|nr:hypothetical protein [Gammaproteobacteria bacterium]